MLDGAIVAAAIAAILLVLVSLAIIDARMLPAAPWRRSVLVSLACAATGVVPWLCAAPLVAPQLGDLYLPVAALGGVATYLATIAVRSVGARLPLTLVFAVVWSAAVFVPTAVLTFSPGAADWPLAISPVDHGGSLAVNVAAGSSALGVLLVGGERVRTATIRRGTGALAVLTLSLGWLGWLVFIEMAIDGATPGILISSILGGVGGIAGWAVVQRIRHQANTLDGVAAGLVSGLVAVTAGGPLFPPVAAFAVGVVAAAAACLFTLARVRAGRRQQWFIVGSHLIAGATGMVLVGLLATGMGYFYTGDTGATFTGVFSLLESQEISTLLVAAYSVVVSHVLWRLLRLVSAWAGRRAHPVPVG